MDLTRYVRGKSKKCRKNVLSYLKPPLACWLAGVFCCAVLLEGILKLRQKGKGEGSQNVGTKVEFNIIETPYLFLQEADVVYVCPLPLWYGISIARCFC